MIVGTSAVQKLRRLLAAEAPIGGPSRDPIKTAAITASASGAPATIGIERGPVAFRVAWLNLGAVRSG
jgi:hypothetical protein